MLIDGVRWMDGVAQVSLIYGHENLSTADGNGPPLQTFDESHDSTELSSRKNYFGRGIKYWVQNVMLEEGDYQSRNSETLGCGAGKGLRGRNMHHQKEVWETRWICKAREERKQKMH